MKILCCCFHSALTCNLFLLTLLTVLQSNGLWAEHTFNSSLGETQMDSMVTIIPSNGREKGQKESSNFNVESIVDSDEQSFPQLEESQSHHNDTSEINEHKDADNNNSNNDEDNNRLISYLEGKIIEIVPITQVPIEDYSENYHSQPNGTGLLSDMESSESIQSNYHHNEPPMETSKDEKEIEKRDKVSNNEDEDRFKMIKDERKQENVKNSNGTQDVNSSPSALASIHSSYSDDLRASANSVAVKVAEVKKKSLAAKMMEKLRKSDKDDSCNESPPYPRPSSLLSGAKDLVYVNAGTDDAKKNIIVVSNGGSSGESSSGSHGFDGSSGRHHHHHHHQGQRLVAPVEPIPSHQIVPIFTPIHENFDSKSGDHRLHHNQQQQQHHQPYPLFHHNEGNNQGDGAGETNSEGSRGSTMLGNDGLSGSSSGGHLGPNLGDLSRAVAQQTHLANLAEGESSGMTGSQGSSNLDGNSQVESGWPPHVDSNGEPNGVIRGHLAHVNQMPGPVGMAGRLHGNRRLQGSGSTLNEQLLHPMSSSSHDLSGTSSGSPSFSSVIESLGLTDTSSSPSASGSGESRFTGLSDIIRNSMLINSPREPEVTPFFESAKGDHSHHHQHHPSSEASNPLNGNTNLKAFSLLSDSALSNYPSLLSRSNDLSSSLLGSSLGSSSSGGSGGSSLNDRLLALLEHSSKSVDDLSDHLSPLTSSSHGLTELTSSRLGGSSLFNEDIGFDDALKRLTMIEMLNKKQIPLTTGLIDELREPSPLHGSNNANPLAFIDNDLRKFKNLQQLAQVQQAIKKSQNARGLKAKAFNREHGLTTSDSDDDSFDTQVGSRGGRSSTSEMRGNVGLRGRGLSSDDESGERGGRRFRPGPRVKTFDALAKFREQRERLKDRFRSSSSAALNGGITNGGINGKTKVEEEEEEYEESGVEHEGDESRSILLGWKKPSRSEEQLITFTDNFHHLNGQLTNSLSSLLHSPSSSSLLTPSSQSSIQSSPIPTSTSTSYAHAQGFNRGTNHQQQQQSNSFSPQQLKFFNHHSMLAHQISPFAHHPNHHQYIHSQHQQTKLN